MLKGRNKYKREKSKLYGVGKDLKLGGSGCSINEGHVEASWSPPTLAKAKNAIFLWFHGRLALRWSRLTTRGK